MTGSQSTKILIVEMLLRYKKKLEIMYKLEKRRESSRCNACKPCYALSWPTLCVEVDVDGRVTEWTNGLSLCLQIIRLINVFTPQKSLEEFQDL